MCLQPLGMAPFLDSNFVISLLNSPLTTLGECSLFSAGDLMRSCGIFHIPQVILKQLVPGVEGFSDPSFACMELMVGKASSGLVCLHSKSVWKEDLRTATAEDSQGWTEAQT